MKIAVTGGAGFIASHIVDAYIARGHQVFVIDDLSTGSRKNVNKQATFYSMDIASPAVAKILSEISPDVLSHHAAQMDLRLSVSDPLLDARINVLGFINLLEVCKGLKIKKVIYASSGGAVYGEQDLFPAPEDHPKRPMSPYGINKLTGEYYLDYYHKAFGIPYVALRYSNVYGPRQSTLGEAGVIAIFIGRLLQEKPPTINGDGKQTRDYVYVDDVVAANVAALDTSYIGPLNIGTGRETDVVTLFRLLREKMGSKIDAVHGPAKTGEQKRNCLETSRAEKTLGWSPRVSLEAGTERTVVYCREADLGC